MYDRSTHKSPQKISKSVKGVAPARRLYQKVEIFDILGAALPTPVAIEMKFCTAKQTHVPVGPVKFDLNRCNESPLRGEKPDFWPVSKFNTGSFRFAAITPVITLCNFL